MIHTNRDNCFTPLVNVGLSLANENNCKRLGGLN